MLLLPSIPQQLVAESAVIKEFFESLKAPVAGEWIKCCGFVAVSNK